MQDQLDAYHQATTCPFCQTQFSDVVKVIPECGKCICGTCYSELRQSLDDSKDYKCLACNETHVLPEIDLWNCTQLVALLRHPIEKPLSEQARKLKLLMESVQEELAVLKGFDPRDHIEQHCLQLELEIRQAAESAIKHIKETEAELIKRAQISRQRCVDALTNQPDESSAKLDELVSMATEQPQKDLVELSTEIDEFSSKWSDYFKRFNALASESEIEAAIDQTGVFQSHMTTLDQRIRNQALCESMMQFSPNATFYSSKDHLGELLEMSTKGSRKKDKSELISC